MRRITKAGTSRGYPTAKSEKTGKGRQAHLPGDQVRKEPYPTNGDETFELLTLAFNVTYAIQQIIKDRQPNHVVSAKKLDCGLIRINEEHAKAVDISVPVIIAQLGPGLGHICIDGNHRAHKAVLDGKEMLDAHVLSEDETLECCYTRANLRRAKRSAAT